MTEKLDINIDIRGSRYDFYNCLYRSMKVSDVINK